MMARYSNRRTVSSQNSQLESTGEVSYLLQASQTIARMFSVFMVPKDMTDVVFAIGAE